MQAAMSQQQILLVQESFAAAHLVADGEAATFFFQRLFEIDPGLIWLVTGNLVEKGAALMGVVAAALQELRDVKTLSLALQNLARNQVGEIMPGDYDTFGAALLRTLERSLGDRFTTEVRQAWTDVYGALVKSLTEAPCGVPLVAAPVARMHLH
jgi:hemoglobin-like flavoprotein